MLTIYAILQFYTIPVKFQFDYAQKTCLKRSILAPIKEPKIFPENRLQMQHSELLILTENIGPTTLILGVKFSRHQIQNLSGKINNLKCSINNQVS